MSDRASRWSVQVVALAGFVIVASVGCGPDADDANKGTAPSLTLRITDADGYHETLARHRGNVVLVDFWATWCGPCVEQFPHTVKLSRKYRDRGLAVIGVSLDKPEGKRQVGEFLERQDAQFDNLLSNYRSPVDAIEAFELPGPVPCYRVYDREGKLRHEFSVDPRAERQFTSADIDAAIEKLL